MKPDLDVARARAADLLEIAERHGAQLKKSSGEWIGPCPACGGVDRFSINPKARVWNCRGFGGGDIIDLEMHLAGSNFVDAVLALGGGETGGRRQPTPEEIAAREAREKQQIEKAAAEAARKDRRAAEIVACLRPVIGTPGEAYLHDVRCIDVSHWAIRRALMAVDTLGWCERTYVNEPDPSKPMHKFHGQRLGAIVGVLTCPVTGKPTGGITRTYIHEGQKVGKAMSLGGARRLGIIRLSPDDEVLTGLHIAEGLETALSGMMTDFNFCPMWAMGSTPTMEAFPVLAGIECLTLVADNDPNEAGIDAASTTYWRWKDAGREVHIRQPHESGDINDVIMRRAR